MASDEQRASAAAKSVETALASLQPIRDLAKNWDIDIAACLEEYLHDLVGDLSEEERRNLPKHAETLNFSQAALVLQQSSSVYSRKVEYLYNLVLQVHEDLITRAGNKNCAANANGSSRKDAEIEEFNAFDPHVEFLLLDDVLPTDATDGRRINLQEEKRDTFAKDNGLSFATAASTTRLSLGNTLTAGSHIERSTATGAGQSATQHVVRGSLDTGSLRLIDGRCDVGEDGILILPGAGRTSESNIRRSSLIGNLSPRMSDGAPLPNESFNNRLSIGGNNGGVDGIDDDHDDDGGGFVFAGDDDADMNEHDNNEGFNVQDDNDPQSTPKRATSSDVNERKKEDPWTLLDAHAQGALTGKVRPLRVGRTCKLPPSVTEFPSQCVTGARTRRHRQAASDQTLRQQRVRSFDNFHSVECFKAKLISLRSTNSDDAPDDLEFLKVLEIPLNRLAYKDEFLYISKATERRKLSQKRDELKRAAKQEMGDDINTSYDDDGFGAMDYGGGDDDSIDDGGHAFAADNEETGNMGLSHLDDMFYKGNENGGENEEPKSFEELCRAHIQAFAKGAEAYASETRLTRRVGAWHEKLVPILEDEENRPEFDIHEYTKRVVSAIESEYERLLESIRSRNSPSEVAKPPLNVDFHAVTKNCPHYEVCRLFLASLTLSNAGNVLLKHGENESTLRIELLDNMIERPMETYLAPSACENT